MQQNFVFLAVNDNSIYLKSTKKLFVLGDPVILEMATIKIGLLPQAKRLKRNRLLCQIKAISLKIPLYESSTSYDMFSHIQSIILHISLHKLL